MKNSTTPTTNVSGIEAILQGVDRHNNHHHDHLLTPASWSHNRSLLLATYPVPTVDPPYQKNFEFEKFDYGFWRQWMETNWQWSLWLALAYIVLTFGGQKWMEKRNPFDLRRTLILWNVALASFSIMAFLRCVPEVFFVLSKQHGFHLSVCSREFTTLSHVFWEWLGAFSKAAELGDTVFIILRKQQLIFLHWSHHATVVVYGWWSVGVTDPVHRVLMTLNYFIHGLMYTYFAVRSAGYRLPKNVALSITLTQIVQMFLGIFVNLYSLHAIGQSWDCARPLQNIYVLLTLYVSQFILFINFFVHVYFKKAKKIKQN